MIEFSLSPLVIALIIFLLIVIGFIAGAVLSINYLHSNFRMIKRGTSTKEDCQ